MAECQIELVPFPSYVKDGKGGFLEKDGKPVSRFPEKAAVALNGSVVAYVGDKPVHALQVLKPASEIPQTIVADMEKLVDSAYPNRTGGTVQVGELPQVPERDAFEQDEF